MSKTTRSGSRADFVTASLRTDILAGRLEPGHRLTFPELCAAYSVSVGVLRESLIRLVDHGIVRAESNLGFSVMSLSDQDLVGLTTTRVHVEPHFVREAVLHGGMEWEGRVVAAHHMLERTPMLKDGVLSVDWVSQHAEYHAALVSGTDNRRMLEITRRLREEADLYRRWYLDADKIGQLSDRTAAEHSALTAAAVGREPALAERLMREQIERATECWLDQASRSSDGLVLVGESSQVSNIS